MPYDNIISRVKVSALAGVRAGKEKGGTKMPIVTLLKGKGKKGK